MIYSLECGRIRATATTCPISSIRYAMLKIRFIYIVFYLRSYPYFVFVRFLINLAHRFADLLESRHL
jgi:hypothetical protein